MDADRRLLCELSLALRWGDMDALGHVNNAAYFTYMEQARVHWLECLDRVHVLSGSAPEGFVIANAHCDFLRPLIYPGQLEIRMYGLAPGRSSFEASYEMRRSDRPEELNARGSTRIVWVDYESGRSSPLPEVIRALLPTPVSN